MLTTDFEIEREGITVPYPQRLDDVRRNHGFVDLRGRPELAANIPEASQSPALKTLLVQLSERSSPLFTLGCDLGAHEEPQSVESERYVAGGYVQIISASYADPSPEDYTTLGHAIAQSLEDRAQEHIWSLRFILQLVLLKLDDFSNLAPSLCIWFYAAARSPEAALDSREFLIGVLHDALTDWRVTSFLQELCNHSHDSNRF